MPTNYLDIVEWNLIEVKSTNLVAYHVVCLLSIPALSYKFSNFIETVKNDLVTILFTDTDDDTYKCLIRDYNENIEFSKEFVAASSIDNPNYTFSVLPANTDFKTLKATIIPSVEINIEELKIRNGK